VAPRVGAVVVLAWAVVVARRAVADVVVRAADAGALVVPAGAGARVAPAAAVAGATVDVAARRSRIARGAISSRT
jgi:hypothetical protein